MEQSPIDAFRRTRGLLQIRYVLCCLLFFATFLVYAMRMNMSVAIIAMNNSTKAPSERSYFNDTCLPYGEPVIQTANYSSMEQPHRMEGEFHWDESQQSAVLYAFFAGYLVTQIPGGYFAEVASVTWILGAGVGLTSLLTCLTSIAARYNYLALIALRVAEGITEGVTYPAIFAFLARWSPTREQNLLVNVACAGGVVGTVVTLPVAAMLCDSSLGWPASFYVFGGAGLLWTMLWFCLAADRPENHRWISAEEYEYIMESRPVEQNEARPSVPWSRLLLSHAVLCLGVARLASTFNHYMVLIELPNYLDSMFHIDITANGWVNAAMNMALAVTLIFTGFLADKLIERNVVDKTLLRKLFVVGSSLIPSLCMFLLTTFGCQYNLILGTLFVNCIFLGFSGGGDAAMVLDIAPQFAGTVTGVLNTLSNLAGFLAPNLVGVLTQHNNTLKQWNSVFLYTAIFTAVGATIFLIFGTAKKQEWVLEESLDCKVHPSPDSNEQL